MKKSMLSFAAAAIVVTAAQAGDGIISGEIAVGGWNHDPSGWIKYPNNESDVNKLDADSDLNLDTETDIYLRAKLEHPVPLLPNIRVAYNRTESKGDGHITKTFTFGDQTFLANDYIHSEAKLDNYDGTLYYQLWDTGLDLDLGLTVRYIDGYVTVQDKTRNVGDTSDINFVVPMAYGNVRVPIPFLEGLSVGAEGNWITYDGSTLYDVQADARYIFSMGLGLEVGYRYQKIKLDDVDNTDADIDIQGVFGGVVWDF